MTDGLDVDEARISAYLQEQLTAAGKAPPFGDLDQRAITLLDELVPR